MSQAIARMYIFIDFSTRIQRLSENKKSIVKIFQYKIERHIHYRNKQLVPSEVFRKKISKQR